MTWVNIIVEGMSREQKIKAAYKFVKKYSLRVLKTPEYFVDSFGDDVYCFAFDDSPNSDRILAYGSEPPAYYEKIVSCGICNNLGEM